MDLTGPNGGSYNVLQSNVAVKTDPSGPTVTITNQDVTKVEATIKNIKVGYTKYEIVYSIWNKYKFYIIIFIILALGLMVYNKFK